MARDRKRAKQRRDRRRAGAPERSTAPARVPPAQPTRADVPGALDHASADVDEFDAALLRGAEGIAATPEVGAEGATATPEAAPEVDLDGAREGADEDELELAEEEEELPAAAGDGGRRDGGAGGGGTGAGGGAGGAGEALPAGPAGEHAAPASMRSARRAISFLQASWAELQRVQWPDRRQVVQATAVVLGFVIVAGVYLGVADYVAKEIVEFVL